jgi:anti-sigma regulatory factor (Ser/Thr protein kinase)
MARTDLAAATTWITSAAAKHGAALPEHVMQRLGVTRRSALSLLRKLEASQWLQRDGTARRPMFKAGALKQVVHTYALQGLQEDQPWARDFAPFVELPANVARLLQHAFAELVNNAIDHSGGSAVTVSLRQTPMHAQLLVSDDGCGLFNRIEQSFQIDDPLLAMFELSKGKLTSMPEAHSGHGLYFTTRLADFFNLHANDAAFARNGAEQARWVTSKPMARTGTSIYLAISLETQRTLDDVLRSHSIEPGLYAFDSTVVPLRLLTGRQVGLESRAQAKRVVSRLPSSFRRAEVDFSGIDDIGHGFADELFRVFPRQHPGLELVPVGMSARVSAMVRSVSLPMAALAA